MGSGFKKPAHQANLDQMFYFISPIRGMSSPRVTQRRTERAHSWRFPFFVPKQLNGCCVALAKLSEAAQPYVQVKSSFGFSVAGSRRRAMASGRFLGSHDIEANFSR